MTQGSADHLLFDRLLTNVIFEKGMGTPGVAEFLAPRVRSTTITGRYMRRKRGSKTAGVDTRRAPGAAVQTGERPGKILETFGMVDHAISDLIPQEITSGMEETELQAERQSTALQIVRNILHDWEEDVFNLLWAENKTAFQTKYRADMVVDPIAKWDTAQANLKLDILELKILIYRSCGFIPNTLLIPNEVWNVISTRDNELREAIKFTQGGPVRLDLLASYFEVERAIVPLYLKDSATGDNEANKMDLMWGGDHIGFFYIDSTPSRNKDTLATTFYWDTPEDPFFAVSTGFNRKRKSEEVEVGAYFTVKSIDMACGGIIADVLS